MVTVLKTVVAQATVGSNPTPSATIHYFIGNPIPCIPFPLGRGSFFGRGTPSLLDILFCDFLILKGKVLF